MSIEADPEVRALRMMAGEYDFHAIDGIARLPLMLQNQGRGDYKVLQWRTAGDSDVKFFVNQTYDGDAEIAKWLTTKDFRVALSLGINREEIIEILWAGLGEPTGVVPYRGPYAAAGREFSKKWALYDPVKANALLDGIGLDKRDSDGFRLRTDNGERLVISLLHPGGNWTGMPLGALAENISVQLAKSIGIQLDAPGVGSDAFWRIGGANEGQLSTWAGATGAAHIAPHGLLPFSPNTAWGVQWAHYFHSGGERGWEPSCTAGPQAPQPSSCDAKKSFDAYALAKADIDAGIPALIEVMKNVSEEVYVIPLIGNSPALFGLHIVHNRMGNVRVQDNFIEPTTRYPPRAAYAAQWYIK